MTVLFIMVTRAGDVYAEEKPMIIEPIETATAARTWKVKKKLYEYKFIILRHIIIMMLSSLFLSSFRVNILGSRSKKYLYKAPIIKYTNSILSRKRIYTYVYLVNCYEKYQQ